MNTSTKKPGPRRRSKRPSLELEASVLTPQQLIGVACVAAQALVHQVQHAIGHRDTLIAMLNEYRAGNPKSSTRFAALDKALSLKELSLVLRTTIAAVKALREPGKRPPGKKEADRQRARDLVAGADRAQAASGLPASRLKRRDPPRLVSS